MVGSVDSLSSITNVPEAPPDGSVSREDFLAMLVAQIRSQDPMNPTSGAEFVAQVAQINSLSELAEMNERITRLADGQEALASSQATSLIGRRIVAAVDEVSIGADGRGAAGIFYPSATASGQLRLIAEDGTSHSVPLSGGAPGIHRIDLSQLPPGRYQAYAELNVDGRIVRAPVVIEGLATGVDFTTGVPRVFLGSTVVALPDVVSVELSS